MRKELTPHQLPDGSVDYGNGAIGPSRFDLEYLENLPPARDIRPRRNISLYALASLPIVPLVAACVREVDASEQPEIKEFLENGLVFPFTRPGRITGGPHPDDPKSTTSKQLVAVDFAAERILGCNNEAKIKEWPITASAKGEVVVVGNEKDPTDPNHSMVKVKHPVLEGKGVLVKYMHLRDIPIKVGDEVDIDTVLGFAGCGAPPRKDKEGKIRAERVDSPHAHIVVEVYEEDSNGKITKTTPIPINKVRFAGYQVNEGNDPYQGTLTKEGEEERVANADECPPERRCDGKRNDIDPQKARLVFSPTPIQPRGGDVPAPSAGSKVPSKAETAPQKIPERELIQFKSRGMDYQLKYPKGWAGFTGWKGANVDMFLNPEAKNFTTELRVDGLFLRNVGEVNAQKWVERMIEESKNYLEQQKRKGEVKKNESLPFSADSGAILETRIIENSFEYEIRDFVFKKGPWIYRFKLKADPSMINQEVETVVEMLKTLELKETPQFAEAPAQPTPIPRAAEAPKSQPPQAPKTQIITVDVESRHKNGISTGINLRRGETLNLKASGSWCMGAGECGGPDGIRNPARDEPDVVLKEAKIGALLARIGEKTVPIGSSGKITADKDGEIVFLMNDRTCCYFDNSGKITVQISNAPLEATQQAEAQKPSSTRTEAPDPSWIRLNLSDLGISMYAPPKWPPEVRNTSNTAGILFYDKEHPTGFPNLNAAMIVITKEQMQMIMSEQDAIRQSLTGLEQDKDVTEIRTHGTTKIGSKQAQLISWVYPYGGYRVGPFSSFPIATSNKSIFVATAFFTENSTKFTALLVGDSALRPSLENTFQKMLNSIDFTRR